MKSIVHVAIESIELRKEVGGSIPHLKYSYFLPYSIMHYGLVDDGLLPVERAVKCPSEYKKMSKSWKILLSPYTDLGI